ncbi:tlde1 domain-containing protein [Dyella monticola]|uniref:tlde1 domain-containing protein n=1 Tax=Dyella monticola TaxID=1927958 RepID=UPI003CCC8F4D
MSSHHSEWFALYRDDGSIDDYTRVNGIRRGNFRLHPAGGYGRSLGCITLPSYTDFHAIRKALLHTNVIAIGNTGLNAYGWIEVVAYGTSCP